MSKVKFHRSLVRITVLHLPICLLAFYALNRYEATTEETIGMNAVLGWIFWLGMFCAAAPAFLSDATRALLFTRSYFPGTFILAILNMLIAPLSSFVTAAWVLSSNY